MLDALVVVNLSLFDLWAVRYLDFVQRAAPLLGSLQALKTDLNAYPDCVNMLDYPNETSTQCLVSESFDRTVRVWDACAIISARDYALEIFCHVLANVRRPVLLLPYSGEPGFLVREGGTAAGLRPSAVVKAQTVTNKFKCPTK